jgi:GAF domain-containing protein
MIRAEAGMRRTLSQRQRGLPVILGPQGFDDSDVELAKEVAAWVAVAVGNAATAARTSDELSLLPTVGM